MNYAIGVIALNSTSFTVLGNCLKAGDADDFRQLPQVICFANFRAMLEIL